MRPTFLGFETARRGLMANQKGIDITGQNLTNLRTPGYTRQRVDLVSVTTNSRARYASPNAGLAGQGVQINGISQIRDSFLDKRFREEYADVGYYDQTSAILGDVESALDELTSSGLKTGLENLLTSLQNFSKNPDQVTHANIVLTAAKNITQVLKQFDTKLNNIMEQQKFDLNIATNDVNAMFEKLANLNKTISDDIYLSGGGDGNYGPNELLDQRNLLLDDLSKYGETKVTDNGDGTIKVEMNGHVVVDKDYYETINMVKNTDNTVSLNWQKDGQPINLTTGALKASLDMINGRGSAATGKNEGYEKGIPYYKDKIDAFAQNLLTVFNSTMETKATTAEYKIPAPATAFAAGAHNFNVDIGGVNYPIVLNVPADGTTLADQSKALALKMNADTNISARYTVTANTDGSFNFKAKTAGTDAGFGGIVGWGARPFDVVQDGLPAGTTTKTLFEPTNGKVTAGNITISDVWSKDPNYIMNDINADGKADNTYILALVDTFNKDYNYGEFTGTFEEYVNFYNTGLGQQKAFSDSRLDVTAAIADEMLNRRDAISGVSMDEEGTQLMVYDKAYKAVSRLMTTLDEALDVLINRTGLVGR